MGDRARDPVRDVDDDVVERVQAGGVDDLTRERGEGAAVARVEVALQPRVARRAAATTRRVAALARDAAAAADVRRGACSAVEHRGAASRGPRTAVHPRRAGGERIANGLTADGRGPPATARIARDGARGASDRTAAAVTDDAAIGPPCGVRARDRGGLRSARGAAANRRRPSASARLRAGAGRRAVPDAAAPVALGAAERDASGSLYTPWPRESSRRAGGARRRWSRCLRP